MSLALDENGIFVFSCSEQELSAAEKAAQDRAFYLGCVALFILVVMCVLFLLACAYCCCPLLALVF